MMRLIWVLLLLPTTLLANYLDQDRFPVLGSVANVQSNDVLNIRINPDPQSEILGTLAHDATEIEIVGEDDSGQWGLINSAEASGWVNLRFIDIPEQPKWHAFETALSCFGTEPFWDFELNVGATEARYRDLDMTLTTYEVAWSSAIAARPGGTIGLGGGDLKEGFSALIENQMCHDGMTDRENALRLRLFIHENGEAYGLDGCCGLSP